ncbi:MAG: methylmalonyl-CoA mutase family protein [Clostridia bacterium]|nr:methylmalonyl-CoA mutase family protein [Clostridia bacterium]
MSLNDPKLAAQFAEWEKANVDGKVEPATTASGIPVKPLYTPLDLNGDYSGKLGMPGEYPYTRGVYPLMYQSKLWTMRQYSGYATAKESNERYKLLFEQGVTGLSVAFDLPTQMGYDSDDSEIEEEVGRVGVAIDTLADMELLFEGIPLDKISTSFTINAITPIILAMYVAVGEKQGVSPEKLTGTTQNDILKEYFARGAFIFPPVPALKMIGDTYEYCSTKVPKFVPVSVCGYHIRETGSNAVQEIAYAFLNAMVYIDNALERGLDIDKFAPRISFNLSSNMDFFEEVAKFRAARRVWARILKERYGAKDPRSWKFLFFAGTAGSTLTAQQPDNNIIRGTLETLALVLGGCQSLTVNTKDEGHTIPTAEAMLTALRTQQIIAYESGITNTVDPLAGSYYVESLTDVLEEKIVAQMDEIEVRGGMVKSIEDGYIQRSILKEAMKIARDIDSGRRIVIGVNRFQVEEEQPVHLHTWESDKVRDQQERLAKVKNSRNQADVNRTLDVLRQAALAGENIMEPILEAVKAYATVGEMTKVLKEVYGTFREPRDVF